MYLIIENWGDRANAGLASFSVAHNRGYVVESPSNGAIYMDWTGGILFLVVNKNSSCCHTCSPLLRLSLAIRVLLRLVVIIHTLCNNRTEYCIRERRECQLSDCKKTAVQASFIAFLVFQASFVLCIRLSFMCIPAHWYVISISYSGHEDHSIVYGIGRGWTAIATEQFNCCLERRLFILLVNFFRYEKRYINKNSLWSNFNFELNAVNARMCHFEQEYDILQ